uniref:MAT1-2-4 n=1 Tax=Sclerotinia trifoliorum TaxID=28548 RepID=A0A193DR12_9HELO|nr:MAT1-2-4 [Sclerotinia trifoliorum]
MQPQTRTNVGAETSTGRSQINATYVLSHMNDFSRDFERPVSKTTTPQPFLGIAPVVYDVYYPVIHYPPQWIGDERELRKRKVNTEQRQSQRELSNVVGHTNKLANSFMKLETGLLNLRFDKKGSVPLIKQLAAGQRIALRIYLQNFSEITKQAADLGLVKLGECETLAIRDVVKSMVDRRRTITQAESNVFADEIFEDEVEFDNRDESGEAHIEPYLKRSEEIRNESKLLHICECQITLIQCSLRSDLESTIRSYFRENYVPSPSFELRLMEREDYNADKYTKEKAYEENKTS